MSIYTRTGDNGSTSLLNGSRVSKCSVRVAACGAIDELNCHIGAAIAFLSDEKYTAFKNELVDVQNDLLTIGSSLSSPALNQKPGLKNSIIKMEKSINNMEKELPVLKEFVLPGGSRSGALIHVCRAVARRSEREVISLSEIEGVNQEILSFLNRLSDFLFVLARSVNFKEGEEEIFWHK